MEPWIWVNLAPSIPSPTRLMAKPWEAEICGLGMGLTVLARHPLTPTQPRQPGTMVPFVCQFPIVSDSLTRCTRAKGGFPGGISQWAHRETSSG